jgi:hypothetical protein
MFYNFNIINILTFDTVFLDWCIVACAPLYFRLPEDEGWAPKHVGGFKTYVQFVNLLCELVGIYDLLILF